MLLGMRGTKCASIALDDIEGLLLNYSPNRILNDSCKQGSMFIVRKAIERGATNWNLGLWGACKGHLEIANLMIEKGATNWDWGLRGACEGGHLEIVNLMIEKGATDWDWGLRSACLEGHLEIVNLMIEKGATNTSMIPRYFPSWKPK